MAHESSSSPEKPPDTTRSPDDLFDADAERDLVGTILFEPSAFKRAKVSSTDFKVDRYKWIWETYEAITADGDHIDDITVLSYLKKIGHWKEGDPKETLDACYNPDGFLHVEAFSRRIRDFTRRRKMLYDAQVQANHACDLSIPLPDDPEEHRTTWTGSQLQKAEFPEPEGPIPGLIPVGLTVLGGRPKRGKSWLMLLAACCLQAGGMFLGYKLQECRVLYYALEDTPRRLKNRIAKLGFNPFPDVQFKTSIQPLEIGGLAEIEQQLREGGFRVVIIDTIRRAMPGRDFNKEGAIYDDVLSQLQKMAMQYNASIIVILHTRKPAIGFDPDPVDDVLGSTGLTASADQVLALYSEPGKKGATLKGRGRDLDDIDLALYFDPETCCWQCRGASGEVKMKETEMEILAVLEDIGPAQAGTVSKTLGKQYSNTYTRLCAMWTDGKIKKDIREGKAFYYLP